MRTLDWIVLVTSLVSIVAYGLYRSRGSNTVDRYLLAGKSMPWYAMALSIMATQASAITFISTTGQSYVDGMRFVQFYFGLPIAMVIICATVLPIFHKTKVYTAYEYLEGRFDAKTRALASVIFLCQRGLSAGLTIYAPALVLSVILGWPERLTTSLMGVIVITYTVVGGIKAVTWSDVQQMFVIFVGLIASLVTVIVLLPHSVSFGDAVFLAGAAGRLNAVTTHFDWNDRFNMWSGLIGGTFLFLSYFGCDQSQVQRYLTGKSIAQSRLSLLFNAVAKIPMQFFILFIGAMVFVFHIFVQPPLLFQHAELSRIERSEGYGSVAAQYNQAFEQRKAAALALVQAHHDGDPAGEARQRESYRGAQKSLDGARAQASKMVELAGGEKGFTDTNYIFLSFVTRFLPVGLVGLVIAVIFAATMSASSGEINSLATVTIVDIYKRHFRKNASDHHYVTASRWATMFWGVYAVLFAGWAGRLGALIVAVNKVGSLFYGSLLGCFVLAFLFRRVRGTAVFIGMLAGEAAILATAVFTDVSWLWYNVIGCGVVMIVALAITSLLPGNTSATPDTQPAR
ncbi:MAG TPA: sodium:solute symporter [Candidatus Sulfopaludibacter sp.]|jgi:Na+/proline symporter|nr:sodium:solute symporter [Candidatus Sulfopaludibacter sp.]